MDIGTIIFLAAIGIGLGGLMLAIAYYIYKAAKEEWWNMTLEETQDSKDVLILFMIQERDKQIKLLEKENTNIKKLLINQLEENRHLLRIIKELKNKRNS